MFPRIAIVNISYKKFSAKCHIILLVVDSWKIVQPSFDMKNTCYDCWSMCKYICAEDIWCQSTVGCGWLQSGFLHWCQLTTFWPQKMKTFWAHLDPTTIWIVAKFQPLCSCVCELSLQTVLVWIVLQWLWHCVQIAFPSSEATVWQTDQGKPACQKKISSNSSDFNRILILHDPAAIFAL